MKQIHNFINGEFVATAKPFDKFSPLDNSLIAQVHEAGQREVDAAVEAARAALTGPWGKMTVAQRVDLLNAVANRKTPVPNFDDGVRNQRVLDSIEKSAKSKQWEKV